MSFSISVATTGGPEVLKRVEISQRDPGPGEVWISHEAIGVNYLDVMQRKGTAPLAIPGGIGLEAAGFVTKVGVDVPDISVGDRVGYVLGAAGAYSTGRIYPAQRLVKLPENVSFDAAATVLFKGITAQYLIKSTYSVGAGTVVLVYGAAGAVGQILVPWAKHLGAFVIGVVSKESSLELAKSAGCDEVLVWSADLAGEVARVTYGTKAHVVYDGVGRDTFSASLDCLRPRGLLASIGASSGVPSAVEMSTLNTKGSLFITRPGLAAHASDIVEYKARAQDVLSALSQGIIPARTSKTFALTDAAEAHRVLEEGRAGGAIVLTP
ncbi:quinone oxidoreductase [Rhizobium sp. ZPR3]|uniref:Quinone oxidoreductase n=2 Tax=unclassified Rhizobium TaxID=2613769 RepID=A0AAU7SQD0_9HYPH